MKKYLPLLLSALLFAEEPQPSLWDFHPIHAGANLIALGKANVQPKGSDDNGELIFNKANVFLYSLLPINRESFFFPRIEWSAFTMNWNKNPKFRQKYFEFVQFALTFLTTAAEKWRWVARVDYNIDAKHFSQAKTYGLFSALLWGTHEVSDTWRYHVGAFGYTGFEGQNIYPVIGFDYTFRNKWLFQAVFPITYSIEYIINKEWRLALKGRPLKERARTGSHEPQPRSVFSYSSAGAELNLHYEKFLRVEAELYAGYNFGGSFYIKDEHGHKALYTNVKSAPYIGAGLNWGF